MTCRTPPEIAKTYRVSPDKVRGWIERGELAAINIASRPGSRPRYVVPETALAEFEARRSAVPTPKPTRRRKERNSEVIAFF